MQRKLLFILILIVLSLHLSAIEKAVVRIPNPTQEIVNQYNNQDYDIAAYFPGRWLDLVIPVSQVAGMRALHPGLTVTQTEADLQANLHSQDRAIPGYRSYQTLMTDLNSLVAQHSDIMTMSVIGNSWGSQYNAMSYDNYSTYNHNIVAVKVSDNPGVEEDEPAVIFIGAHHAREPLGVEACMAILQDIADGYNTDTFITDMVNNSAIWFVPMTNPDGHKIVWDNIDSWWRKNLRDNNNNMAFDTESYYGYGMDGVDLNRNYGYGWGYMSAQDDPGSVVYHGPGEFSEPEINAIKTLIETHPIVACISFHTYSELVLYPYGYIGNINAPDVQELSALAVEMANLIPSEVSGNYTPQSSWALYPASGGLDDWAYGERGVFSYTIEMGTTFIPDATTVNLVKNRMILPARKMMQRITKSILKGHVTNSVTNAPLEATIYVEGIDNSPVRREPYTSKAPFSSYYRLLPVGTWTVRYFAEGYLPVETQVTISADTPTISDVSLVPGNTGILNVQVLTFGDVPVENARVEFVGTDIAPILTDAQGSFTIPDFTYGYYNIRVSKPTFETILLSQTISGPNLAFLLSDSPNLIQDFETNLNNWTTTGTWGLCVSQSQSGTKSLADSPVGNYQEYFDSYAKYNVSLNVSNTVNASLNFFVKANINQDGDYCALEYSLNNQTWTTLDYYDGSFDWTEKIYNLNGLLGQQIFIRFHMFSNDWGDGDGIYIDNLRFFGSGSVVSNEDNTTSPLVSGLAINPNPFNLTTKLSFDINTKQPAQVELKIFNLKGQQVSSVINKTLTNGAHSTQWNGLDTNGRSVSSGVYFAVLKVNGVTALSRKLLLLK